MSTACFLAAAGHEVVVVERHGNVAQEGSFGHAGPIGSGAALPWSVPDGRHRLLPRLLLGTGPILLRPRLQSDLWRWLRRWLRESELERYRINGIRMQRIADYGRAMVDMLCTAYEIEHQQTRGVLHLFRSPNEIRAIQPALDVLAEENISHHWLDASQARAMEPMLDPGTALEGALHFPKDGAGNCPLFIKRLRQRASASGVHFHFNSKVDAIEIHAGRPLLKIDGREFHADGVVVAAGMQSAGLLAPLGIRVPLYPARAYSLTAQIKNYDAIPQGAVLDNLSKTAITRLGDRIRVSGIAELGACDDELHPNAIRLLIKAANDWFPNAANYGAGHVWTCMRPMLPDGSPLLGATPVPNLYVNFGHGTGGWGMAVGAARITADIISGHSPEIDIDGLTVQRYGQD